MFKKFGILTLALAAITLFHPAKANAQECRRGGSYIQSYGPGSYAYGYRERDGDGWRDDRDHRRREHEWRERERHEWREHEWREHERNERYYRQGYYVPQAGVYFSWRGR